MARPSATRCRSPPDNFDVLLDSRCSMRNSRAVSHDPPAPISRRHALAFERKADVLLDVHMRIESKQLEYEGDVARRGAAEGDVLAVKQYAPVGRQLETGDHAKRRRLAAA